MSLAGVDASWLPEPRKQALRAEFTATLDALTAQLDPDDKTVDLAIERSAA
jgi:adenosine deaminase